MGGYGFTEWEAPPQEWLPGTYTVEIFVGLDWKVVAFINTGDVIRVNTETGEYLSRA